MIRRDGEIMDTRGRLTLKFIMSKLKRLVVDNSGQTVFMDNLDEIFKDVFGIKHFTKRLDDSYDDRETVIIINEIGLRNLMTLCNTSRIYNAFVELVQMNYQIHKINKILRKAEKRGKHKDKHLIKELDYYTDLYKDAIKTLRKKFGIAKKKSSYKKRFRTISDLVETKKGFSYYDEDGEGMSSVLYDDDDDLDDDDDDMNTEFERFVNREASRLNKKKAGSLNHSKKFDDDDDLDDDDLDEEDIDERITKITNNMSTLTSAVQALINTQGTQRVRTESTQSAGPVDANLHTDITNLTRAVMKLSQAQNESLELQRDTLDVLNSIATDDDLESDDVLPAKVIPENERSYIVNDTFSNGKPPTREELIDMVNNSNATKLNKAESDHSSSISTPQ